MKNKDTLFEKELEDVFLKSVSKGPVPKTGSAKLSTHFYICSSASKKNYYQYYFELKDHYIFCKRAKDKEYIAYMDVEHAFMKVTKGTQINGKSYFGLKFIKKKTYEELFHEEEAVVMEWMEQLKKCCILTKFRCYFDSKQVLGKGNFAKVFLVERKRDRKEYAVKVFDKETIMKDELERKCLLYEIKMMRAMNHPRVLTMHELYEGIYNSRRELYLLSLRTVQRLRSAQSNHQKRSSERTKSPFNRLPNPRSPCLYALKENHPSRS
jgi:hypothetical protein